MSQSGQGSGALTGIGGAVLLGEFELPAGTWFPWHAHEQHQLVWASRGVVSVNIDAAYWVLPPTRALWVPAGTWHRTGASGRAVLRGVYADVSRCPVSWQRPWMVRVSPLLRELFEYLSSDEVFAAARERAEAVVFDLLEPIGVAPIGAPLPSDERARAVAEALLADPADPRRLTEFGPQVGASSRTLARLFLAGTGLSFGRWRTQARLVAALPLLADDVPLTRVARKVGYASTSAFVAAFRRAVGVPPVAYFAH